MATDRVDFLASRAHFADHLRPVWLEVAQRTEAVLREPAPFATEPADPDFSGGEGVLTVVSAIGDMMAAYRAHRRVVLMEHGAGQHYTARQASYVGGPGRTKAELVLVPNEQAAERHRRFYPAKPPVAVVGCPRLDDLLNMVRYPSTPPTVCVTWHWDAHKIAPEARSAWPFIGRSVLKVLCAMRAEGQIRLAGSGHPRILDSGLRAEYVCRDIPVLTGDDVFSEADILVADNTSTMFEFAALGRPVVVLDAPVYRPHRHHGLRFWDCAAIGPRVGRRGGEVAYRTAVEFALRPDAEQIERREEIIERVYPYRGYATQRAADAIMEVL